MKGKIPTGSVNRKAMAKKILKKGGYAAGGATKGDDGEPDGDPVPKGKKAGGPVSGAMPKKRLDKPRRYASGGGVEGEKKKKGSAKTEVNIVIAGGDKGGAPAAPMMPPPGAMPPPPPPAARPPMPMPPGGPAPGAPMRPPGAMKRGGAIKADKYPIDAGAGGGKGRLEKAAASKSHRPKRGDDK